MRTQVIQNEPELTEAVRLDEVKKVYGRGESAVVALDGVTLGLERGSFTAVMGPSGSGKSTFLHCAAGLDAAARRARCALGGHRPRQASARRS